MIAVDTYIPARYYVDDRADAEAASQRRRAERVMRDSAHVFVPLTVVLELTWILRSFYAFSAVDCARAIEHLVGLPNVTVEAWPRILEATRLLRAGLDFADALHLAMLGRLRGISHLRWPAVCEAGTEAGLRALGSNARVIASPAGHGTDLPHAGWP
jgi:predicted nucleic-acid-binding protein